MKIQIVVPVFIILVCQFIQTYSQSNFVFNKQLTVISNDCYTRTAIGSRLNDTGENSTSVIQVENVSDCEDECNRRRNTCKVFSFGINIRGNATCILSNRIPQNNEGLVKDVDYDVYVRKPNSPDCHPEHYKRRSKPYQQSKQPIYEPPKVPILYPTPTSQFLFDDDLYNPHTQLQDIFSSFGKNHQFLGKSPLNLGNDYQLSRVKTTNYNVNPTDYLSLDVKSPDDWNLKKIDKKDSLQPPKMMSSYEQFNLNMNKYGNTRTCYSKLLAGKRVIDNNGRRSYVSRSLRDCSTACTLEKTFFCAGFNYRDGNHSYEGPVCELTSKEFVLPYTIYEPDFDYYERDSKCKSLNTYNYNTYGTRIGKTSNLDSGTVQPYPTNDYKSPGTLNSYDLMFPRYQPSNSYLPALPTQPENNYQGTYGTHHDVVITTSTEKSQPWGSYGNTYGSSYGYELSTNSITYLPPTSSSPQITSTTTTDSGKDIHVADIGTKYKGNFIYENTNVPIYKSGYVDKHLISGHHCFARAKAGFKIARNVALKSCLTLDIKSCEDNCAFEKSFSCQTFAFRYNVDTVNPTDNCFLSAVPLELMNFYVDLEPDKNYDIYTVSHDHYICHNIKPGFHHHHDFHHHDFHHHDFFDHNHHEHDRTHNHDHHNHFHDHNIHNLHDHIHHSHYLDDCFWRVKSGYSFPKTIIKISAFVDNLGECQIQCTKVRDFICRSFVFRFEETNSRISNCYLSDHSYRDFDASEMVDMHNAEMYERNSFGRGCEPHPFLLYDNPKRISGSIDENCYVEHHKHCKLNPSSVKFSIHTNTEAECRNRCTLMRRKNTVPCISFSYSKDPVHDNCLMSDLGDKDLRPHFDYSYHDDHVLFSWQELEPKCASIDVLSHHHHDYDHHHHHVDKKPHLYNVFDLSPPQTTPPQYTPSPPEIHFVKPDHKHQHDDSRYHYHTSHHHDRFHDFDFEVKPDFGVLYNTDNLFHHYTVKGYPCKQGSVCERNKVAGFWSCETEGEAGSWDYCCAPDHHCGFSEGYPYPWCKVGPAVDQWRPCSERYYPYGPELYTERKCEGRHWPVIYLHGKSPPNATA